MEAIGQEIVVLAVVLTALAYLGYRAWGLLATNGPGAGCHSGGCGSCPSGKLGIQNLVTIGQARAGEAARSNPESRTPGATISGRP